MKLISWVVLAAVVSIVLGANIVAAAAAAWRYPLWTLLVGVVMLCIVFCLGLVFGRREFGEEDDE